VQQEQVLASLQPGALTTALREQVRATTALPVEEQQRRLVINLCNMMFFWMVVLAVSGRALAARLAGLLRWPSLSRSPLRVWRLPDAALLPLIAGIALLVFADRTVQPSALTLLVSVVLGYSIQGMAVVESVLLDRGMSPVLVALSMLFVIAVSLLLVLPVIAVVGLSDVWLDYRRMEPSSEGVA
jgi:hypothetical protein